MARTDAPGELVPNAVAPDLPTVTIVFLVYNRREELRTSLDVMLGQIDYPADRVDVIVVDNASQDGADAMVRERYPAVRLIRREENSGVSAWNDGFAVATGEWVLALDDDCYLPRDGLRRAVEEARARRADLVSFGVQSLIDPDVRFDEKHRTGLLSFWGCAVLIRRPVLERLTGYDPEIFVWANELEFMFRFFDAGFRHLHAPEIVALHDKALGEDWAETLGARSYLINARHFAYIAAKHMRARDALAALVALLAGSARHMVLYNREARRALPQILAGFRWGLRHRAPVRNGQISRVYRRNFESYASPWWFSRPLRQLIVARLGKPVRRALRLAPAAHHPGRREEYFAERGPYYPESAATLEF